MGGLRSLAAPARPLRLGGIPSQSPCEGAVGERNAARFFAASAAPIGACGERNYALFAVFSAKKKSKVGIPKLLPKTHRTLEKGSKKKHQPSLDPRTDEVDHKTSQRLPENVLFGSQNTEVGIPTLLAITFTRKATVTAHQN